MKVTLHLSNFFTMLIIFIGNECAEECVVALYFSSADRKVSSALFCPSLAWARSLSRSSTYLAVLDVAASNINSLC